MKIIIDFFKLQNGMGEKFEKMPRRLIFLGSADKWAETINNGILLLFPFILKAVSDNLLIGKKEMVIILLVIYNLRKNMMSFVRNLTRNFGKIFEDEAKVEIRYRSNEKCQNISTGKESASISIENYLSNFWKLKVSYLPDLVSLLVIVYAIYKAIISTNLTGKETLGFLIIGFVTLYTTQLINEKHRLYYVQHRCFQKEERQCTAVILTDCAQVEIKEFQSKLRKEKRNIEHYHYIKCLFKEINNIVQMVFKVAYVLSFISNNTIDAQMVTALIANIAIFDAIFQSYEKLATLLIERVEMLNVIKTEQKNLKNMKNQL